MQVCHQHNLAKPRTERCYGIRLTLPPGDTLSRLIGADWQSFRWYETELERDRALEQLRARHAFARPGDFPTYVCEKVVRESGQH
jgi:hypothetical protein